MTKQIIFPAVPADLKSCFVKSFPDIPDADLTPSMTFNIIADAKLLDRVKTECGMRAVAWIDSVQKLYGVNPQTKK